jgi:ribosomal protein L7/L12
MVEKAPAVLKEGVDAVEGELLTARLVKAGCVIEMV